MLRLVIIHSPLEYYQQANLITCQILVMFSGSPFQCLVDSCDGGFVSVYGTGLVGGMSGEEESFTVVSKSQSKYHMYNPPCFHSIYFIFSFFIHFPVVLKACP